MEKYLLIVIMAVAGAAIALQSITNSKMGQITGVLEGSFISFGVGTLVAALLRMGWRQRKHCCSIRCPLYLSLAGCSDCPCFLPSYEHSGYRRDVAVAAGIVGQLIAASCLITLVFTAPGRFRSICGGDGELACSWLGCGCTEVNKKRR